MWLEVMWLQAVLKKYVQGINSAIFAVPATEFGSSGTHVFPVS